VDRIALLDTFSCESRERDSLPCCRPQQLDLPLPANVTIDLASHHRRTLPAPTGWEILQRNGQAFITPPGQATVSLDQAQFGMLRALHSGEQSDQHELSISFLTHLRESRVDGPWSRHLLACLHRITGADLLIGARAVARHPHFQHYAPPFPRDQSLGAMLDRTGQMSRPCFSWTPLSRTIGLPFGAK
jgi:hypothetical protein